MRKIFTTIITFIILLATLCINVFAFDAPSKGTVLRVSGMTKNGESVLIQDYSSFEDGWNAAMELAINSKEMNSKKFVRVIVDIYDNWNAVDGEFTSDFFNGKGFNWDAIYFQPNVRMTVNLNGFTINRGLKEYQYNGEVIYIDKRADVIINNGTITGGFSCNGAGGIHINDGANVTLNSVNVIGNAVEDDNGTGIAVYDNAILTMYGGSVSNNLSYSTSPAVYGGGVYIEDSSAFFENVVFENNQGFKYSTHGAAVYVNNGILEMDDCQIIGNGVNRTIDGINYVGAYTIIDISNNSNVYIRDTKFLMNGYAIEAYIKHNTFSYTSVIKSTASYLTMESCTFTNNKQVYLIESNAAILTVSDTDFTNNDSFAFYGNCADISDSTFTNCLFSYNEPMLQLTHTFYFNISKANLTFIDCDFGFSTFNNKKSVTFIDSKNDNSNHTGAMLSDGSFIVVVTLLSLMTSILAIAITVFSNKKKVTNTEEAACE